MRPLADIERDLRASLSEAEERRNAASENERGLYACSMDWATDEELERHHELLVEWMEHPDKTAAAAKIRAQKKREARRQNGVEWTPST